MVITTRDQQSADGLSLQNHIIRMVKPREAVPDSRLFSHYHTDFRQRFAQRLMNFPDCTEFINIGIKPQIVIELSLIKGKDAELEKAVAAIENKQFY